MLDRYLVDDSDLVCTGTNIQAVVMDGPASVDAKTSLRVAKKLCNRAIVKQTDKEEDVFFCPTATPSEDNVRARDKLQVSTANRSSLSERITIKRYSRQ